MKKFIINTVLFISIFLVLVIALAMLSSYIIERRNFHNWEVESNLLIMKTDSHYDLMLLGISHARNFSRYKNHQRLEKILDRSIINLGRGSALCGSNNLEFYLEYFYSGNNTCDTIIYFLSPSMMYAKFLDRASNAFADEPFVPGFFVKYLFYKAPNKYEKLFYYVKSKLSYNWIKTRPLSKDSMTVKLDSLDHSAIKEGMKLAYLNGQQSEIFNENAEVLEKTIHTAFEHNSKLIFIIPPALFGKWRGHYETMAMLEGFKEKYNIDYYDYSESVLEPGYYYDHHHLNSAGVDYFAENYLVPILK